MHMVYVVELQRRERDLSDFNYIPDFSLFPFSLPFAPSRALNPISLARKSILYAFFLPSLWPQIDPCIHMVYAVELQRCEKAFKHIKNDHDFSLFPFSPPFAPSRALNARKSAAMNRHFSAFFRFAPDRPLHAHDVCG